MPKWVRKAQSLGIAKQGLRNQFSHSTLKDIIAESGNAMGDLQFVIDHTSFSANLTEDTAGLITAETFCRNTEAWKQRVESFPDEQVDRLLALFFGHVFTKHERGSWVVYPGKYHVYHPVVIELAEHPRQYIEPFLYCSGIRTKQLQGAHENKSLFTLYESPARSCTR